MTARIAVVGAGASGMALTGLLRHPDALMGFQRPLEALPDVDVFEQSAVPLRKLRATGNGRCNFTNQHMHETHYSSDGSVAPILERFGFQEAVRYFDFMGIPSMVLESGMAYPATFRAETVAERLQRLASDSGVMIRVGANVEALRARQSAWFLETPQAQYGPYDAVVLSSGGGHGIGKKEWSNGYTLARQCGHTLTPLHPGIVALRVLERERCAALRGIRMRARLFWAQGSSTDDVLFTEYGLSGMATLRLSNRILDQRMPLRISLDLFPDETEEQIDRRMTALSARFPDEPARTLLEGTLSAQVIHQIFTEMDMPDDTRWKQAGRKLLPVLKSWPFTVRGARKDDPGQVSCGGIPLREVDLETMESRQSAGLYLIGEVLNVQGECGGYNLHWAWASAHLAAGAILRRFALPMGRCV